MFFVKFLYHLCFHLYFFYYYYFSVSCDLTSPTLCQFYVSGKVQGRSGRKQMVATRIFVIVHIFISCNLPLSQKSMEHNAIRCSRISHGCFFEKSLYLPHVGRLVCLLVVLRVANHRGKLCLTWSLHEILEYSHASRMKVRQGIILSGRQFFKYASRKRKKEYKIKDELTIFMSIYILVSSQVMKNNVLMGVLWLAIC